VGAYREVSTDEVSRAAFAPVRESVGALASSSTAAESTREDVGADKDTPAFFESNKSGPSVLAHREQGA